VLWNRVYSLAPHLSVMSRLALYFRVFATGVCCTLFLFLHIAFYWTRGLSTSSIVAPRHRGICLQKSYAYGEWVSDPATSNTSECDLQVMQQIDLVREQGGWLLIGGMFCLLAVSIGLTGL
jgi:hypothetical protein